jgi:hypothetical protein
MHLFVRSGDAWRRMEIAPRLAIARHDGRIVARADAAPELALACAFVENGRPRTALIAAAAARLRVNGYAPLPVTVLEDRDEIAIDGETFYFGSRAPAAVVSFPAGESEKRCARCKTRLAAGEAALRCPACAAWHHAGARRDCWQYDRICGACFRDRAGLAWEPGGGDDASH